jgi:DNA-binding transcriptional MerR regulator
MNITITELSEVLNLSQEVLRKYEKFFSITVGRNEKGNRIYSESNVKIFQEVKKLTEQGRTLKEIKLLLNLDNTTYSNSYNNSPKVEVVQEEPEKQNYELLLKPYTERIAEFKKLTNELIEENKLLIKDNATLSERVKNKDDIITFKDNLINSLEEDKRNFIETLNKQTQQIQALITVPVKKAKWQFWK